MSGQDRPLLCVVGARPNYMKMAPLLRAFSNGPFARSNVLMHTGQHYDPMLKDRLFDDLGMRAPDENLEVRSGSHAQQTAEVMKRFEPLVQRLRPAAVVVVGDVNSTLACALVASKMDTPVVHVEAGLRSFDRGMPEEVNRVLTDQLASWLYTTEPEAAANLVREGISQERVVFAGNLMIDSLLDALPRSRPARQVLSAAGCALAPEAPFALVTLHRPSNVDEPAVLAELVEAVRAVAEQMVVAWPLHPRTEDRLDRFGLLPRLRHPGMVLMKPQGYLEMVGLMHGARIVLTDSGGVQEETTVLGVPCLTLRDNTERPVTLTAGTNQLVGRSYQRIVDTVGRVLETPPARPAALPHGWDGHAARRVAEHLARVL
jgi:UDP-N-acetylglucosamine 2-epimerase (non-hydrolysing)